MEAKRVFYIYNKRVKPFVTDTEKKPFTYIGLTLLSLSFFGAFAIRPALITITDLRHQIDLARKIDSDLQTKLRNISRSRPIYDRVKEDFSIIEDALPEEKPLSNLISSLNANAGMAGVSISSLRISSQEETAVKGRTIFTHTLSLQISGNFPSAHTFIENLENSRRQFSVESFHVKSLSRGRGGGDILSAAMTLKTFSLGKEEIGGEEELQTDKEYKAAEL